MSNKSYHLHAGLLAAIVGLLILAPSVQASVTSCIDTNVAFPVDPALWGVLEPADHSQLPDARDSTNYTGQFPNALPSGAANLPLWSSIDVENGYIFVSYTFGVEIWDANPPYEDSPNKLAEMDGSAAFPSWPGFSEIREFFWDIDAPSGDDTIVAAVARSPVGLVIIDTTNKSNPTVLYQDDSRYGIQVYAAKINGRAYAFVANEKTSANGIHVYDMTAAKNFNRCVESSEEGTNCPGVYKGRIGSTDQVAYVDGFQAANGHHYLAFSSGIFPKGISLWDVTDPLNPVNMNNRGGHFADNEFGFGVAVWQQGSNAYLGTQTDLGGRIYKITNCLNGCSSFGSPVWSQSWNVSADRRFATYSKGGATPYLYFGNENKCSGGRQREFLYDLTPLSSNGAPEEITPEQTISVDDEFGNAHDIDYWGWYYARNPTGFSQVMPRVGKFWGDHFYRVAWTLFDVHKRVNADPTIQVSGPATGYQGESLTFSAQALNCTAAPNGWTWSTNGGTTSSTSSNASISWSTAGTKTVGASNSACPAATVLTASVNVQDPAPAVSNVTATPANALICQPVTFTATASGKPPLTYAWSVEDAAMQEVATGGGASYVWDTSGATAGTYVGKVSVSGVGAANGTSPTVTLNALPPLPAGGTFTPTADAFTNATVQFHVVAAGATEWDWDFGTGYTGWTNDPVSGPNPVHSYDQAEVDVACGGVVPCTFDVRVRVRNCIDGEPVSGILATTVSQLAPLIANFAAQCPFGICGFSVSQNITFVDNSSGAESWDYDWDGDGTFESPSHSSPVTTHAYASVGTYRPKLRVRRGAETATYTHGPISITSSTPPPPPPTATISISGVTSGQVDQALTYTASAANCSPSNTGWTWTATGVPVSDKDNSATVTFSSAGTKTITATNSACGSARGSRNVSITSGDGGGGNTGNLKAAVSYSPQQVKVGDVVTFDGSGSSGEIASYSWTFGDGGSAFGQNATHTYQAAGTYQVSLSVSTANCLSPNCTNTKTVALTVTADPSNEIGPNGCKGDLGNDPAVLCLLDSRFQVRATFYDPNKQETREAKALYESSKTGFFWFFRPDNVEVILKVLDGGAVNGNWWVFYGGLSNVHYEITVTDTGVVPNRVKRYVNEAGTICGEPDTGAFSKTPAAAAASTLRGGMQFGDSAPMSRATGKVGIGSGSSDSLLLLNGRFRVTATWRDVGPGRSGDVGIGRAVNGTDRTGYFWFFNQENLELVVKMIDATAGFGHFWVLWGGITDVEYTLTVEDLVSGDEWQYTKEAGDYCGGADTTAFDG